MGDPLAKNIREATVSMTALDDASFFGCGTDRAIVIVNPELQSS